MQQLSREERLRLLKFACSLAWADLSVASEERGYVHGLVKRLHLDERDRLLVEEWLRVPPEVDPQEVPHEHRRLFLDTLRKVIAKDGTVGPEERESMVLLEQLML